MITYWFIFYLQLCIYVIFEQIPLDTTIQPLYTRGKSLEFCELGSRFFPLDK
jgi:hypothetical protein